MTDPDPDGICSYLPVTGHRLSVTCFSGRPMSCGCTPPDVQGGLHRPGHGPAAPTRTAPWGSPASYNSPNVDLS